MSTFEEFEQALQDALPQLYDPAYVVPEVLLTGLGRRSEEGAPAVQAAILQAIEELKPPSSVPTSARSWRIYGVLSCRYTLNLTQEEAAERLGITPRHLRREQRVAVEMLARHLWGGRPAAGAGLEIGRSVES